MRELSGDAQQRVQTLPARASLTGLYPLLWLLALSACSGSGPARGSSTGETNGSASGGATTGSGSSGTGSSSSSGSTGIAPLAPTQLSILAGEPGGSGNIDGQGAAARFYRPNGLVDDGAGLLYVADSYNSTLRTIDVASSQVTTIAGSPGSVGSDDGTGRNARFNTPDGLTLDGDGYLYVVDTGTDLIRQVSLTTLAVATVAGSPGSAGTADGTGSLAAFNSPQMVASDGAGTLYVSDSGNNTIRKIAVSNGEVTTLAGSAGQVGETDGAGTAARFNFPLGLGYANGELYVVDYLAPSLRMIDVASGVVTTLASGPSFPGSANLAVNAGSFFVTTVDSVYQWIPPNTSQLVAGGTLGSSDGIGSAASFFAPGQMSLDGRGNLFVSDSSNDTVRRIALSAQAVTTVVGVASHAGSADGTGTSALFSGAVAIACDRGSNLYVADTLNDTIRAISLPNGAVTTLAGAPRVSGSADGTGSTATFDAPRGIAFSGIDALFVADSGNHTIRAVIPATGQVTTLAGLAGRSGVADGPGTTARFVQPEGLASDGASNLYVADSTDDTIRRLLWAGGTAPAAVSTLAGLHGLGGSSDGTGTAARFNEPQGVALDGAGGLYVADSGNHTIRLLTLGNGTVVTVAGKPGATGNTDGSAGSALFSLPTGLGYDGAGNLFIADLGNSTIRRLSVATSQVSTVIGVPGRIGLFPGVLPGGLNGPNGLAVVPGSALYISDSVENTILVAM